MSYPTTPSWPTAGAPTSGPIPSPTLIQLCNYYTDLLAVQYADKPNAMRLIALFVKQALGDYLVGQLNDCFNLATAVGTQLDILGKYIGAPRTIGAPIPPGLFSFWDYASSLDPTKYQGTWNPANDAPTIPAASGGNAGNWYVATQAGDSTAPITASFACGDIIVSDGTNWAKDTNDSGNGLTDYTDPTANVNGIFYDYLYSAQQVNTLSDTSYQTLLKLKSIENTNDGTLFSINALLFQIFGGLITVKDNQDMSLAYTVVNTVPLTKEVLELFLPKPMGVGITVTIVSPTPSSEVEITTESGVPLTTESGEPLVTE